MKKKSNFVPKDPDSILSVKKLLEESESFRRAGDYEMYEYYKDLATKKQNRTDKIQT